MIPASAAASTGTPAHGSGRMRARGTPGSSGVRGRVSVARATRRLRLPPCCAALAAAALPAAATAAAHLVLLLWRQRLHVALPCAPSPCSSSRGEAHRARKCPLLLLLRRSAPGPSWKPNSAGSTPCWLPPAAPACAAARQDRTAREQLAAAAAASHAAAPAQRCTTPLVRAQASCSAAPAPLWAAAPPALEAPAAP